MGRVQDELGIYDWTLAAGLVPGAKHAARPGSAGLLLPLHCAGRSPPELAARAQPSAPAPPPPGESQAVLLGAIKLLLGCVETRLAPAGARAAGAPEPTGAGLVHDAVFEAALALYRHGAGEGSAAQAHALPAGLALAAAHAPRGPPPPGAAAAEGTGTATSQTGHAPLSVSQPREATPPPPPRVRVQRRAAAAAEASIRASKRALEGSAEPESPPRSRARRAGPRHSHARASSGGSDDITERGPRPRALVGTGTASSPFRGVSRHRSAAGFHCGGLSTMAWGHK